LSEIYFPIFSSIDLTNITAAVYSTELCKRLRAFLSALPPSSPHAHVNELLVATADFERSFESWNIRFVTYKYKYFSFPEVKIYFLTCNTLHFSVLCREE